MCYVCVCGGLCVMCECVVGSVLCLWFVCVCCVCGVCVFVCVSYLCVVGVCVVCVREGLCACNLCV